MHVPALGGREHQCAYGDMSQWSSCLHEEFVRTMKIYMRGAPEETTMTRERTCMIIQPGGAKTIGYRAFLGCGDTAGVASTNPIGLMMISHTNVITGRVVDNGLRESKRKLPGVYQEVSRIMLPVPEMRGMPTFLPMPIKKL